MNDYSELKKLAEAAPEGPWFGPEYAAGTSYVFDADLGTLLHYESIDTEQDDCLRYVAAANPAAVLALIDEVYRLECKNENQFETIGQYQKITGGDLSMATLISERIQLKADVKRLAIREDVLENLCDARFRINLDLETQRDHLSDEVDRLRNDAKRLEKATVFVKQLCDTAGKQPSIATGYLHDILSVMINGDQP